MVAALACLLLLTGLIPGGILAARADTTANLVQLIDTAGWDPNAPGPAGVAHRPETDTLIVVDSDKNNESGWDGTNLWEIDLSTNQIVYTGVLVTDEPTGAAYDPDTGTLFISNDPSTVFVLEAGPDERFGTDDDVEVGEIDAGGEGAGDTEDPAYDPDTDQLFVLSGDESHIYVFGPGSNGSFGDGDDVLADDFPVPDPPSGSRPSDWEGMAVDPSTDHLLVGAKEDGLVYEITKTGGYVQTITLPNEVFVVTGLGVQPAAGGSPKSVWIADRGDTSPPETNDGQLIQVTIGPVPPQAPVAQNQTVGTQVGQAKNITLVATDANGDSLTYSIVAGPSNGAVSPGTGPNRTYTPTAGFSGQDSFTFKANDGVTGDSNVATVTIDVEPNVAPVLDTIGNHSVNESTELVFTATASDSNEGQTLGFSLVGTPPSGATIGAGGTFTWTPTEAQGPGTYPVTVRVTDSATPALTDSETINITVNEVNRPPVAVNPGTQVHGEGSSVDLDLAANDPDLPANTLTWNATGLPPGLTIQPSSGVITGTVGAGAAEGSPYTVSATVTDNGSPQRSHSANFSWQVVDTNASPTINPINNKSVVRGQQLSFAVTASDPDGDGLTFALVNYPAGAVISAGGSFTWTPNVNPGTYNITVKVTDNGNPPLTDQESFSVTVTAAPPPPPTPDDPFIDDDGSVFENAIEWLAAEGITAGCNPPANDRFCPDDYVTRAQMAAFIVRAQGYSSLAADFFVDDEGHVLENAINRLRTAGVTQGCNPPTNDRYCPDDFVTRGQMAAFLVRAFGYSAIGGDFFVDDEGHVFENAINRLRTAGVTQGCNPPVNDRYCPDDYVTRGQMAAFLKRALGG